MLREFRDLLVVLFLRSQVRGDDAGRCCCSVGTLFLYASSTLRRTDERLLRNGTTLQKVLQPAKLLGTPLLFAANLARDPQPFLKRSRSRLGLLRQLAERRCVLLRCDDAVS